MNKSIYDIKLTAEQIAEILNVSHMTIYRWREKGMPCYKESKSIRFDLSEVEKWLGEQGASPKVTLR